MIQISTKPGIRLHKKNTHQKKTQSHVSISQYDSRMQANEWAATAETLIKENCVEKNKTKFFKITIERDTSRRN